jgi:hypothetical protein
LTDDIIRRELARLKENPDIFLAHFFQILERQTNGQPGLFTTDHWNIAYMNYFWAVFAGWDPTNHKWDICANSMCSPNMGWDVGNKVFSQQVI